MIQLGAYFGLFVPVATLIAAALVMRWFVGD